MSDQPHTPTMRIGELAETQGINPKTIRYYEDIGLLPAPQRTRSGYRLYSEEDRERLQFIVKARAIGLGLEEIAELLTLRSEGQQPCAHLLELLDRKLAAVEQHLRALADFRQELLTLREEGTERVGTNGGVCAVIEHHELGHRADPCNALAPAGHGRLRRH